MTLDLYKALIKNFDKQFKDLQSLREKTKLEYIQAHRKVIPTMPYTIRTKQGEELDVWVEYITIEEEYGYKLQYCLAEDIGSEASLFKFHYLLEEEFDIID